MKISPLAPARFPDLPQIGGVRMASAAAGVKYQGRDEVLLVDLAPGTTVAGVFTRSSTRSAPVRDCEAKIANPATGSAAILVNSGNSNAFTGRAGEEAVNALVAATAQATDAAPDRVFTASTGVIGEPLPHDRIAATLGDLAASLAPDAWEAAARAIMTTDTFPKGACAEVEINGRAVRIAGIAKGSGMIAPDMATMLVYIFTDAALPNPAAQDLVSRLNATTFNCITVDGDTSTSDTLIFAATGAAGVDATGNGAFARALEGVMTDLAHQVVRDGEGASKFVTIAVTGAASDEDARKVAFSVADSPLVKTAIAGEDPNWGRIVMAVGKSGAEADRDLLSIRFGDVLVAKDGWVAPDYEEAQGAAIMARPEIEIGIDLGLGAGRATVWTCDLTHDYISINADYRS